MSTWKRLAVNVSDNVRDAAPSWQGHIPACSEACPHHDGKRCRLLGIRPGRVCEPAVEEMGKFLDDYEGAGR